MFEEANETTIMWEKKKNNKMKKRKRRRRGRRKRGKSRRRKGKNEQKEKRGKREGGNNSKNDLGSVRRIKFLTVICLMGMKSALCLTRSKILASCGLMKASSETQTHTVV